MKEYYKNKIRQMLDNDLLPLDRIEFVYLFMQKSENREKAKRAATKAEKEAE